MKIIYVECNAEEMRANRSVIDCLTEAFSGITRAICGVEADEEAIKSLLPETGGEGTENDE